MKRLSFGFGNHRFEILDRPLRWMKPDELSALQARLKAMASARFGREPDYSYFCDASLFKGKVIVICQDALGDSSFCAMCHLGRHEGRAVLHLGSVFSARENKGQLNYLYTFGLLFVALKAGLFRKLHITSLTHTPKIFGIVADGFENVFPDANPANRPTPLHLALRDRLIERYIRPEWDVPQGIECQEDFVMPALRRQKNGEIMFPDTAESVPKYRADAMNRRVVSLLNYARGDEVLQIGELWVPYSLPKKIFNLFKNSIWGARLRASTSTKRLPTPAMAEFLPSADTSGDVETAAA